MKYTLLQNILLGLTLAAPIGPVNLEIIKRGLQSGFRQALLTGVGAMSADATYLTLIFFGLVSFLNITLMKITLGLAGSLILIYLGFLSVKDFFREAATAETNSGRLFKNSFITGYVLAISSPMTIVWWTGVFGALLTAQTGRQTSFSTFWSCLSILLGCFLWVVFLSSALHWGKRIINDKMVRMISLIAGLFLIVFGFYFLFRAGTLMMR
ncbi:MAG TPA: LysE family transporter [Smithella sp.]|nr:LysE family transporter [Smithella sp.]HOG82522.1 LysE family transporter [Smithellaceae bacterium]